MRAGITAGRAGHARSARSSRACQTEAPSGDGYAVAAHQPLVPANTGTCPACRRLCHPFSGTISGPSVARLFPAGNVGRLREILAVEQFHLHGAAVAAKSALIKAWRPCCCCTRRSEASPARPRPVLKCVLTAQQAPPAPPWSSAAGPLPGWAMSRPPQCRQGRSHAAVESAQPGRHRGGLHPSHLRASRQCHRAPCNLIPCRARGLT